MREGILVRFEEISYRLMAEDSYCIIPGGGRMDGDNRPMNYWLKK